MNYAGFQQYVAQDTTDSIKSALVLLGVETTLVSATVQLYSPGGAPIGSTVAATVSGNVATYSRSWSASTFNRDEGYKAKWVLTHAGGTKDVDLYFSVVRRRFESMVGSSDLRKLEPRLVNPSSASDLSQFLNEAWERITQQVSKKIGDYAGNVFFPEQFRKAHIYMALGQYFRASQFGSTGTADADKSKKYFEEGYREVHNVLSSVSVDMNDDGQLDESEKRQARNVVKAWR